MRQGFQGITTPYSMATNQKLELTWIGKEKRPQLEPRIVLEGTAQSYYAKQRMAEADAV